MLNLVESNLYNWKIPSEISFINRIVSLVDKVGEKMEVMLIFILIFNLNFRNGSILTKY